MDLELRGEKVLITGASKGIGLAAARASYISGTVVTIDAGQSLRAR